MISIENLALLFDRYFSFLGRWHFERNLELPSQRWEPSTHWVGPGRFYRNTYLEVSREARLPDDALAMSVVPGAWFISRYDIGTANWRDFWAARPAPACCQAGTCTSHRFAPRRASEDPPGWIQASACGHIYIHRDTLHRVYRLLAHAVCTGCGGRGCLVSASVVAVAPCRACYEQSTCGCWRIYWHDEYDLKDEIDNGRVELYQYGDDFYKQTVMPEDADWLPHPPMV